jgi:hypothetical protein
VTILEHPAWPALLPHLFIRRGTTTGVNGPRHRIEVRTDAPAWVFDIRTACANCGLEIQNVRVDARGGWTFNLSCPLDRNMRCARMRPTTMACQRVRDAIAARPADPSLELFP